MSGEWALGAEGFFLLYGSQSFIFFITFEMNNMDSKQGLFHFAE